jgi:methionine synthase II (cobalamin-independent)
MSRQTPCANNRTTGCQGVVTQRGNVLCPDCIESRKQQLKTKRDSELDELAQKNAILEHELNLLKQQKEDKSVLISYKEHTDKEMKFLSDKINSLQNDIDKYIQEKNDSQIHLHQCKLDNERLKLDNERLNVLVKNFEDENKVLKIELQKLGEYSKNSEYSPFNKTRRRLTDTPPSR